MVLVDLDLLLDLVNIDVGNIGLVAIDDLGELLESGALGLDVHEEDEDELGGDPALFVIVLVFIAAKYGCCSRKLTV